MKNLLLTFIFLNISFACFAQSDIQVSTNHLEVQIEQYFDKSKIKFRGDQQEFEFVIDKNGDEFIFPSAAAIFDFLEQQGFFYLMDYNRGGRNQPEIHYIFRRQP